MNTLVIDNLTMRRGKHTIFENVSFTAYPGEILAVLGANGSGKTTLLRAVQGSLPVSSGTITFGETELSSLSVKKRAAIVTAMPQEIPSADGLTGLDLIETAFFPAHGVFSSLTEQDRIRIDRMAQLFGIHALLEKTLDRMSVGERQMISLCRAAVQDTPILLLDEPASALDFNHTETLFRLLHTLAGQEKIILTVLHDPSAALRHADQILRASEHWDMLDTGHASAEEAEMFLQPLYPGLLVHRDPLFCYTSPESSPAMQDKIKEILC